MSILAIVQSIFPNVDYKNNFYETPCVKLHIGNEFMIISNIKKCDENTGNQTIEKVIYLGRLLKEKIGIKKIKLMDTSVIHLDGNCGINMSIYFILSTGQSWYNRAGFISFEHKKEIKHNTKVRSWSVFEYVKNALIQKNLAKLESIENLTNKARINARKDIFIKSSDSATKFTEAFFSEFKDFKLKMSIGYIFSIVKERTLIINCIDSKLKLLISLIDMGFYLFNYENDLVLVL